ncbi:MAG: host attachment protein [Rhizobiaceae bacterium]|nr:host attachment protein [Rhizobiaceae bacterium]
MIIPNRTVVAVADGQTLRLFRNKGHEPRIELVAMPDPDLEIGNQGSGTRHRSSTANPDKARLHEDNFAAAAASYLNRQALSGDIEQLIVIADPRTLGEMRRHFHDALVAKLVGDVPKNLTDHDVRAIETALERA